MRKALVVFALCISTTGFAFAKIPSESTHAQIVSAMQARIKVPVLIVGPMAQAGTWMLTRWDTGDSGGKGEAVLRQSGSAWAVVRSAGGTMENARYLESIGVPAAIAQALVKDMKRL
ncbi:MAG TPA: hypothetical protein VFE36_03090 [Candidatus Baltobacteraceae bacterium]|jgi:hypothetical protein|nr:hypothetical protein [Candidatus Baltobacteraceae bacterium]